MESEMIDFLEFYDSSHIVPNSGSKCQVATHHAASHVGFNVNQNDGKRIPEGENFRPKRRTKSQHCESCRCQQTDFEIRSNDFTRKGQHLGRKGSEKPEASLSQHQDYGSTGNGNSPIKSCRVGSASHQQQQQHCYGHQQQHQHNRQQRNRPGTPHYPNDNNARRNGRDKYCCRRGDVHSDPEIESPRTSRRENTENPRKLIPREINDDKRSTEEKEEEDERVLIETGSSVDKDDEWQQYHRDQQELKDLREDVRRFDAKRRTSQSRINCCESRQDHEDLACETQQKIDLFVSKLPARRAKNNNPRALPVEHREKRNTSPSKGSATRIRRSSIDPRRSSHSSRIEERAVNEEVGGDGKRTRVGKNLEEDFADFRLDGTKHEVEDEADEDGSETEEDAKQLLRKNTETDLLRRKLKKSWSRCMDPRNSVAGKKLESGSMNDKLREKDKSRGRGESLRDKREKINEISFKETDGIPLNVEKENYFDKGKSSRDGDELETRPDRARDKVNFQVKTKNATKENFERDTVNERTTYWKAASLLDASKKNCPGSTSAIPATLIDNSDIELNSKMRAQIDEMIDDGINREVKRLHSRTFSPRSTKQVLEDKDDEEITGTMKKFECFCEALAAKAKSRQFASTEEKTKSRIGRPGKDEDCPCRRIARILTDNSSPDYVRKLKKRRWDYLESIKNIFEKLYDLERFLDSCSPERHSTTIESKIDTRLTDERAKISEIDKTERSIRG